SRTSDRALETPPVKNFRACYCVSLALACLISAPALTWAQNAAKPVSEKWRPKDGSYIDAETEQCRDIPSYGLELGKKRFVVNELWACKITKITDTAPSTLRLDMICDEVEVKGDDEGKIYNEIMIARRIDEGSFS